MTLRWRVLTFIAALFVIAAVPVPEWTRLPTAALVYLVVVFPALTRDRDRRSRD